MNIQNRPLVLAQLMGWFVLSSAAGIAELPTFANGHQAGTVRIPGLVEASGIVASRSNPGVLWTHNDKGGQPRIFALDTEGRWLGTYLLPGARHVDYEDIAQGPGPEAGINYLFVGDIGDKNNNPERPNIVLYRIPEPAVYLRQAASPRVAALKGVVPITLTYPDGPRNAEAIAVDPRSGDLFLFSKEDFHSAIYRASKSQLDSGSAITLSRVGQLSFDVANAADISPDGSEIVVRQENFARLWQRAPSQSIVEALTGSSVGIPVVGKPTEKNGEAIGFHPSGNGYFTLSDSLAVQPLYYFARTSAPLSAERQTLIEPGSSWLYLDDASLPAPGWREGVNKRAHWTLGEAPFGYGDGDEETDLGNDAFLPSKVITTFYLKTFTIDHLPREARLELRSQFDDGVAVFINGREVARSNLPHDAGYLTTSILPREDLEDAWTRFEIDASCLRPGTNRLAAEVHQSSHESDDLSFDAQLILSALGPPTRLTAINVLAENRIRIAVESAHPRVILQQSPDLINWQDVESINLDQSAGGTEFPISAKQARLFFRLRVPGP